MGAIGTTPVLAEAADVLSGQLQVHLRRLAKLLVRTGELEKRFAARLIKLRFDKKQRKALAAVTASAAAKLLVRDQPLAAFFEQVEYSGRRLAKLDMAPADVLAALQEYDRLLDAKLRKSVSRDYANFQWAREQLSFCVVLTLNNAFYQVREAEAQAFYDLAQAELESRSQKELLARCLEVLARFCQAEAGQFFLRAGPGSGWQRMAALPGDEEPAPVATVPVRSLTKPRYIERGSPGEGLLLDAGWRGRYASCWSIPFLSTGGDLVGVLQLGFSKPYEWLPRELRLLSAASERALLALEKARLMEDLAAREKQVRQLATHMLQVEEAERRRIRRELHDETGQMLLCLRLQLEMLERSVPEGSKEFETGLARARREVEQTIVEIRRVLADLSPAVLDELGLAAALRQLVSRYRGLYPVRVRLRIGRVDGLPGKTASVVYRLVQECCTNITRHSSATSVNISLSVADEILRLRVDDNGVGFQVDQALARQDSFGLAGMRERVALLGGQCEIRSRPGSGTSISIELPAPRGEQPDPLPGPAGKERRRNVCRKFEFC